VVGFVLLLMSARSTWCSRSRRIGQPRTPVRPRVGNVKNNDPSLTEPIAGEG